MNRVRMERRSFLKAATQALLAAPAASMLGQLTKTQQSAAVQHPAHPAIHKTASAPAKPKVTLNVRDLGATGDGKTKDTLAIQQAIESAAQCLAAARCWCLRAIT